MNNLFNNIYKDKKVLITGHTGFKGSWLTLWLTQMGAEVAGYALKPNTDPSLFEILDLKNKINHIEADVRNYEDVEKAVKNFKPDIIFHLAAQPLVRYSYQCPRETCETNIMGTVNLLEAVRNNPSAKVVVNITSDKCYENRETTTAYHENDPMGGSDPYSSSKGASEIVTASYRKSFFNPIDYGKTHHTAVASVRAGNVIGGGDWSEDRLIPDCVKSIINNIPITIRNPEAVRPWQHVLEPLSGYLWLGALMWDKGAHFCQGWNFGPENREILTVKEVVEKAIKYYGSGQYQTDKGSHPHEAKLLTLDINKAINELKWHPVYSNDQAIKQTIEWYKYFYENKTDICSYTTDQICSYIKQAGDQGIIWSNKQGLAV
jgi:CDP-glucose 4,6-dehydratase